jgi:hypothetical protein
MSPKIAPILAKSIVSIGLPDHLPAAMRPIEDQVLVGTTMNASPAELGHERRP